MGCSRWRFSWRRRPSGGAPSCGAAWRNSTAAISFRVFQLPFASHAMPLGFPRSKAPVAPTSPAPPGFFTLRTASSRWISRAAALDREIRIHRFRAEAQRAVALLTAHDRVVLDAYTAGVNAGLHTLDVA